MWTVAYLGFHFGGGGSKYFWKSGGICMALRALQRGLSFARGVWGHAPPRIFLQMVQFGAF